MSALRPAEDRENRARVLRKAEVHVGGRWHEVLVRDISSSGCQLRTDLKLPLQEEVALNFQGGLQVTGKVRWQDGLYFGLSFEPVLAGDVVKILHSRKELADKKNLNKNWTDASGYNRLQDSLKT